MNNDLIRRGDALAVIEAPGDNAATEALGQLLCCNGHMCGCQGATVQDWLLHWINAIPAVQPVVKVKPLVWDENQDQSEGGWLGRSDAGIGPAYHATSDAWSYHRGMFWHEASDIEAAKAAAQADYEARVLAAIEGPDQ